MDPELTLAEAKQMLSTRPIQTVKAIAQLIHALKEIDEDYAEQYLDELVAEMRTVLIEEDGYWSFREQCETSRSSSTNTRSTG